MSSDVARREFPDAKQRVAVCHSQAGKAQIQKSLIPIHTALIEVDSICKQNIDEVEAMISLIVALLEDEWTAQMVSGVKEIMRFLSGLDDQLPTLEPDVFNTIPANDRSEFIQRLVDHVLKIIYKHQERALDTASERVIEDAGHSLLLEGSLAVMGSLSFSATATDALLTPAAAEDLRMLLKGHTREKEVVIRDLVNQYVRYPTLRAPEKLSTVLQSPDVANVKQAWKRQLERAVGADSILWLAPTVDLWAYRWFTIGSYRALRQSGASVIVAQATIDSRTTPFCRWVNGRQISVARADRQVDKYIRAALHGDINEAMSIWPLLTSQDMNQTSMFSKLFRKLGLPPYHFRCRTVPKRILLAAR